MKLPRTVGLVVAVSLVAGTLAALAQIAHAILRHLGATIGKRDYLGNLTQQIGGDYS